MKAPEKDLVKQIDLVHASEVTGTLCGLIHTMFRREYDDLKPKINKLWERAGDEQENPIDYLAYLALKRVEASWGSNIESDQSISSSCHAVASLFKEIHAILQEA